MSRQPRPVLLRPSDKAWPECSMAPWLLAQHEDRIIQNDDEEWSAEGTDAHNRAEAYLKAYVAGENPEAPTDELKVYTDYVTSTYDVWKEDDAMLLVEQKAPLPHDQDYLGTVDAAIVTDDRLHIIDLKWGQGVNVSPTFNSQTAIYARAFYDSLTAVGLGVEMDSTDMMLITIVQPRYRGDNPVKTWSITFQEMMDYTDLLVSKAELIYEKKNLRYSQLAPMKMFEEKNTRNNLPAQIDIYEEGTDAYDFLFVAKGGGSANKTFLFQGTPSLLTHDRMIEFLREKILTLGTAACPPYHLAIVIGGTSAEMNLKTVKLASTRYLDTLPTEGSEKGHEMEAEVHKLTQQMGVGAQFGGKYFCHDVRVIRLPRHGASLPIGLGVSCSADRQAKGRITREGVFLEQLETDPSKYMPEIDEDKLSENVVKIDLNRPMADILAELGRHPIKTQLSLSGSIIVARDLAHAKIRERLEAGEPMPDYFKNHPIYYAGPAKTPAGYASGSFGPTTAGRMDSFVDQFQSFGGSMVMLAKGNRSRAVREACGRHGGFYLGSIGGPAARLAQDCIKKVEVVEYAELGMEAIWRIEVENFPAFIVIDDKGNDFFKELNLG
ncbi:MAG: FumA C-terminus/TtdB family hydratase beta subunit [Verrucomicrobiales bacterium]|nr:FumA C-terminus/TtdB family hydratase beta subunit [Verrucomicrobiales bacterium]